MSLSLCLAGLWAGFALFAWRAPLRWRRGAACAVAAAGVPLLGLVTWQTGPVWGLVALAAGLMLMHRLALCVAPWAAQPWSGPEGE